MNPLRGILFKILAVAAASAMAACVKAVLDDIPAPEAVFFRSAFALPPLLIFYAIRGELYGGFRVKSPRAHLIRGAVGVTSMGLIFVSVGLLPLPEATAITYAAPMFCTLLAAPMLGERLRAYRLTAVGVGLIGVAVVTAPRLSIAENASPGALWGVAAALAAAVAVAFVQILVRKMTRTETSVSIVLWFTISSCGYSALTMPFWAMPTAEEFALLALSGLLGGIAQTSLTEAYRQAEASLVAPFDYASLIFAALIGWFVFAEAPATATIIGSAITVAAGIAVIRRERKLGLERGKARPLMASKV